MNNQDKNLSQLVIKLFDIEAIKFGSYKIKSGSISPIYFDLRVIVSYPDVLETISNLLYEIGLKEIECDQLCGVPYTALPIATVISIKSKIPMLIRRKEMKDYGTKKMIEGKFKQGDQCVIIEDVITSGSSVIETTNDLRKEGLNVSYALIILDREQGGKENLQLKNINVKSLFTINQMLNILVQEGKIDQITASNVKNYIKSSPTNQPVSVDYASERLKMSFEKRSELTDNTLSKQLYQLMLEKKSNLCLAADLKLSSEVLELIDKVGPFICVFKTHVDIIKDYNDEFINKLVALAKKHKVFIMEDRKYADIGNTVALQYSSGVHNVVKWADFITIHSVSGPGVLKGIKSVFDGQLRGAFVVAEMSSEDNLMTSQYTNSTVQMCDDQSDLVVGFVCQDKNVIKSPKFIQLTPGVKLSKSKDDLGQNYNSPEEIILNRGADIAVVGRGITESKDPASEAKIYRDILWQCYEKRIEPN